MAGIAKQIGITCPGKSQFYVCKDKPTRFLGCCKVDPCQTPEGICPFHSLEATTMQHPGRVDIPEQDCLSHQAGVKWYACAVDNVSSSSSSSSGRSTSSSFMGCCAVNACRIGRCPEEMVRAAMLHRSDVFAAPFLNGGGVAVSSASSSSSSSSSSFASSIRTTTTTTSPWLGSTTGEVGIETSVGGDGGVTSTISGISQGTTTWTVSQNAPIPTGFPVGRDSRKGLSHQAVAGIATGSSLAVILILGLLVAVVWYLRKSRPRRSSLWIARPTSPLLPPQLQLRRPASPPLPVEADSRIAALGKISELDSGRPLASSLSSKPAAVAATTSNYSSSMTTTAVVTEESPILGVFAPPTLRLIAELPGSSITAPQDSTTSNTSSSSGNIGNIGNVGNRNHASATYPVLRGGASMTTTMGWEDKHLGGGGERVGEDDAASAMLSVWAASELDRERERGRERETTLHHQCDGLVELEGCVIPADYRR